MVKDPYADPLQRLGRRNCPCCFPLPALPPGTLCARCGCRLGEHTAIHPHYCRVPHNATARTSFRPILEEYEQICVFDSENRRRIVDITRR